MTPQQLHDIWLVVTVIATLEIAGISIYLWRMFQRSTRKWFFWTLSAVFAAVAIDQTGQEIKNLLSPPPLETSTAVIWLLGRLLVVIVAGLGLGYMVFGRNGKSTPAAPEEKTGS